jgi:hypothetical protein
LSILKTREVLQQRQLAYRLVFGSESGRQVLADLAKFCRAHRSTFHTDPRVHAALEGRREVWLRIQDHLQLTDDEIYKQYK